MTRLLTCPSCGAAPGNRCRARGGEDDGKPLAINHDGRPEAGTTGLIGRPPAMTTAATRIAVRMRGNGVPVAEIAQRLGVSRATVYRYLTKPAVPPGEP